MDAIKIKVNHQNKTISWLQDTPIVGFPNAGAYIPVSLGDNHLRLTHIANQNQITEWLSYDYVKENQQSFESLAKLTSLISTSERNSIFTIEVNYA